MKRWIFGLVLAFALALAGGFPASPRFDRPVTVKTSAAGDPLEAVLAALAKSVGLTPVIKLPEELAKTKIRLDIEQKPFRKVWDVVLKTFGDEKIDFALLDDDLLLVAPPEVVARAQGQGKAPEKPQKPAVVRAFLTVKYIDPDQAIKLLKTELPQLSVVRVPNQRVLIVRGTPELIDEVKRLLAKIDVAPEVEQAKTEKAPIVRRFYAVRYLDPTKLAAFLGQEVPGIKVAQVPGQKVLIVRGTEAQQKEVQAILAKVDVAPEAGPPIYQRTFRLSYAKAGDVIKIISNLMQRQADGKGTEKSNRTSEFKVSADQRTNSIVVQATSEQIARVATLISELDVPTKQVLLNVRIEVVDSTIMNKLGMNWDTISGGNAVFSVIDGALQFIFDSTRSLASLNLAATFNALESQDLAHKLSNAKLLVEDNYGASDKSSDDLRGDKPRAAEVNVGGKLLVPIETADGKKEIREFPVGLVLRVRPHITPDRNIELEIFAQTGEEPREGPQNSIIIPKKSILTKLTVHEGDTVVIGGLIEKKEFSTDHKVPILGDIPLIGMLFSSTEHSRTSNDLVITISPRIVENSRAHK